MKFLCVLLMLVGGVAEAALTSSPIYSPCLTNYVRTDIGVCTRSEDNASDLLASVNTCHDIYIPKARRLKLRYVTQIESANAVGNKAVNVFVYPNMSCAGAKYMLRSTNIYEAVATPSAVLLYLTGAVDQSTVDGHVSFQYTESGGGGRVVFYSIEEYVDR